MPSKTTAKAAAKKSPKKNTAKVDKSKVMVKSVTAAAQSSTALKMPALTAHANPSKLDSRKLIKPLVILLILATAYLLKDEFIVASVNGKPVTRWSLIRNLEQQSAPAVLENITMQILVEQELKKAGVVVAEADLDAQLGEIEEQLSAQGQSLDDLLKAQGLTRKQVKEQLALSKGLELLLADRIAVSEEEVQQYFEDNKDFMGDVQLADVYQDIENQVKQEKLMAEQQKWFAEVRAAASVKYYKFAPSNNF